MIFFLLKVLLSIGETFRGAKGIQAWLNSCARLISRSIPEGRLRITKTANGETVITLPKNKVKTEQMTSVIWTTPLGLPIVQPYRKLTKRQVSTAVQSVYISDPNVPAEGNEHFFFFGRNSLVTHLFFLRCDSQCGEASYCFSTQFYP